MQQKHPDKERKKLEHKLGNLAAKVVLDFDLIAEGDRILVAISGGKDSFVLLRLLKRMQAIAPFDFELAAIFVDATQSSETRDKLQQACDRFGVPFSFVQREIWDIIEQKLRPGSSPCSLCSRLRRGILYTEANERGFNKLALGHHKDDLIQTFLLNIIFTGQIKTMAPKLVSDDGRNVVIRPLAYCREIDVARLAKMHAFQAITCERCVAAYSKRNEMAELMAELERRYPGAENSLFASLKNVRMSHLLDPELAAAGSLEWLEKCRKKEL